MQYVKDIHIIALIFALCIFRVLDSGGWFGCVVIAGFLVALFDIIVKVYLSNTNIVLDKYKSRYGVIFICLNILLSGGIILLFGNAIWKFSWINNMIVLDEITLLTLMISLPQESIINKINSIIRKK